MDFFQLWTKEALFQILFFNFIFDMTISGECNEIAETYNIIRKIPFLNSPIRCNTVDKRKPTIQEVFLDSKWEQV